MKESYTSKRRVRRNFGRIDAVSDMPSLIEVQTGSYADFIESDKEKGQCEFGLEEVFKSIFPIKDFSGSGELEFVKYELEEPKYDVDECIKRDMTYAAPVKATLRLVVWDIDEATGAKSIHDIKEQDVYMGDIPLMTDKGTFIFNGTERVVVLRVCSLIMTKARPLLPVNICLPPALFLIAVPGSILNLMPKIWFMHVSTVAASCRLLPFCILCIPKKPKTKSKN